MITLDSGGVRIDETDWASANPRRDGIEVFFRNGPRVYLDREFLTHALDLIEACCRGLLRALLPYVKKAI